MTADSVPPATFAFTAHDPDGEPFSGSINAPSVIQANQKLALLKLREIQLDPVSQTAQKPKRLGGPDFQAFNTQLAYLAAAGLPIEPSLRLIAKDMRTGALSRTVHEVADELDAGASLSDAFAQHASQFPPLYSQLINAGIRTGNLPAMLLGLSRHLEMTQQLRSMLWKATAYPTMVLASLLVVVCFLGLCVFPQFKLIFHDFHVELPQITQLLILFSDFLVHDWPALLAILLFMLIAPPLLLSLVRSPLRRQHIREIMLTPLPVIGPAIRQNLLARWCDALKLGVEAGLDLPAAIDLAGNAVASPRLIADGQLLIQNLNAGQPLDKATTTRWLPQTLVMVITLAATNNDLPSGLLTLSSMFQQQAQIRIATIPALLTPVLIMFMAVIIGFVVIALFAPMIALVNSVSGPFKS